MNVQLIPASLKNIFMEKFKKPVVKIEVPPAIEDLIIMQILSYSW
jgi:hypothetical protein